MATGVKIGMSIGMSAHQSSGFAMNKAAAASIAATTQIRIAILRAHTGTGNIRTKLPPRNVALY